MAGPCYISGTQALFESPSQRATMCVSRFLIVRTDELTSSLFPVSEGYPCSNACALSPFCRCSPSGSGAARFIVSHTCLGNAPRYGSSSSRINEMICCTLAERASGHCTGQAKAELLPTAVKLDLPIALAAKEKLASLAS